MLSPPLDLKLPRNMLLRRLWMATFFLEGISEFLSDWEVIWSTSTMSMWLLI